MVLMEYVLFKQIAIKELLISSVEQLLAWMLLGASLFMVFPVDTQIFFPMVGAFSLSWIGGYVAVFAPGGIGVRELLLTIILGTLFSTQEITAYATIHRLVWVLVEIILGGTTALFFGIPMTEKTDGEDT